jgi:hypothetical protein
MPGCAIKMQLCQRANSLEEAFARMRGKPFTTEVKLDGYRLQVRCIAVCMFAAGNVGAWLRLCPPPTPMVTTSGICKVKATRVLLQRRAQ